MLNKNKLPIASEDSGNEVDLGRLIGTVIDHKWLIIGITSLFATLGILYCLFSTPIYQANALVQVEQNASSQIMDNISSLLSNAKPDSTAEIELIQSRMVIGKTVNDLGLNVNVEQKYFPIFGKGWARLKNEKPGRIAISRLNIPDEFYNVPLTLVVKDNQHYVLENDGKELLTGEVNKLVVKDNYSLLVSGIDASPGTTFTVTRQP
ncbi:Wzz/FepE/Etk N-terminal domain-containing protein, partial [Acerihabitans sp.]|uniref:Wzz/FepE/Etk N-terminal domain-containing protein n=1 Tax=Acerihabitans sp. TaxID=2811394 RepID=UPI002EDAB79A